MRRCVVSRSGGCRARYSRVVCRVNGPAEFPWHDICLWRRLGACDATSAAPIVAPHEAVMDRIR